VKPRPNKRLSLRRYTFRQRAIALAIIVAVAAVGAYTLTGGRAQSPGNTAELSTPLSCPAGSVLVSPGNVPPLAGNTAYCFAAGTYHRFSMTPQDGDRFYGGGHTTLDGGNFVSAAFSGSFSNVTIDASRSEITQFRFRNRM
jgi:hypothetical protein